MEYILINIEIKNKIIDIIFRNKIYVYYFEFLELIRI